MLEIGSSQTGQKLFTVRSFGGGRIYLPANKARLLLEFLRDLDDASIFVQVGDAGPTPASCMLGGTIERELASRHRLSEFGDAPANDGAINPVSAQEETNAK